MDKKHTPGPWTVDAETGELCAETTVLGIVYGAEDYPCLDEDDSEHAATMAECQANGRLIAAAPDLLLACQVWLDWFDCCAHLFSDLDTDAGASEAMRLMRAAVARAEAAG